MKTKLLLFFLLAALNSHSQTGGNFAFPFIDLCYNARSAGLGGEFISVMDADLNLGIGNPSLLNSSMHKQLSFNQALLAGGINYGMVDYGFALGKGTMGSYIKYISYGTFTRTAVNGVEEGTFSPFEMVIGSAYGKQLNKRLSIGASANIIYSSLESYFSTGMSIDMAGSYYIEEKQLLVTALVKNAGIQFNSYASNGNRAPLPAEIQMAVSYKLAHAPFRFSLLAHHLNTWDITYVDPNEEPGIDPLTGDTIPVKVPGFMEKLGRHFTYQVEAIVSKNIHLRGGFDFQRRMEMRLVERPGLAGFSFGLGLYFKKFSLDYGFMIYSKAGTNQMLTFSTNLEKWRK